MRSLVRLSAEGEGFVPPSSNDFNLPPIFGENAYTTKPIFMVFFSVILISVFFIAASRKAAIVPSKLQFAGESIYAFVRNDLALHLPRSAAAALHVGAGSCHSSDPR